MKHNMGEHSNTRLRLPFILSLALHLAIIVALIAVSPVSSYRLSASTPNAQPVVHAAVIDADKVEQQVQSIKLREAQQKAAEQQRVNALQAQADAARQAKIAEEQRLAQIKADQQKALQQKQLAAQQAQAEQQQLAQLKILAKKQQQEALAKAQALKKQQEAAQAKALAEKKQAELTAKQNELQQQLMQQQITNEQQLIKSQEMKGIIDQYRARILMAIGNQWLIPDGADPTISCEFTIDLTPEGKVAHAQLVRSSGNPALDQSAQTAIYKASPLPVPKDPDQFAPFRHFTLKMTPQDITH